MPSAALRTIAVDVTPVLPGGDNGGAKRFALELLRHLAARSPQTQFVLLTQAASHAELASLDGANLRRVAAVGEGTSGFAHDAFRLASRAMAPLPHALRSAVAKGGYRLHSRLKRRGAAGALHALEVDLLFCPFTAPTFEWAGVPVVSTIYDLQFRAYPRFFTVEDATLRERAFTQACERATALAAISEFSRQAAICAGGLDSERITTIPLRMARKATSGDARGGIVDRLGLLASRYLLYPANYWLHKNHERLLQAFALARDSGLPKDIVLVCTGAPGKRREELTGMARELALEKNAIFPGFLAEDELWNLLANARGLIFPSLYEGFGLPVADAMASGIPVACSNVAALPEVAGDAALLFDPLAVEEISRAILALVSDPELRDRLAAAGRHRAVEFMDTPRMVEDYWRLFERAVGR